MVLAATVLDSKLLLGVLGLVVLLAPTSRELSRRVLIAGTVLIGGIPLLWWWKLPLGDAGHAGLVLALVLAGIAAWFAVAPGAGRARLLLPRVRWSDGAAAVASLVAVWVYLPTLRVSSPGVTLTRFLRGWDHSAHFDMTAMILKHGSVISHIEPGALGQWSYARYPQGFHAVTATVMEALIGSGTNDPGVLLATYARAMTFVIVVAVVTVLAGVCSLPSVRRRPLIAFPAALFVVATFTLGPGGMVLHDGFPNFLVACAMLACLPLIAIQMTRPMSPPLLAALGAAALGVVHNWSLLLTMGGFVVVAVLFPWSKARWPSRRIDWVAPGVVVVVTFVGLFEAWTMLRYQPDLADIVVVGGGVTSIPVGQLALVVAGAIAACAALVVGRGRRGPWRGDALRAGWTGLVPLAGLGVATMIAVVQIHAGSGVGYYFWKYAIALQLVAAVVLVAALSLVLRPERRRGRARAISVGASVLLGVALVGIYGLPKVYPTALGSGLAPGGAARADFVAVALQPLPAVDATAVLDAAAAHVDDSDVPTILLPFPASGAVPQMMMGQWFNALTSRWTDETQHLLEFDPPASQSNAEAIRYAKQVLAKDPNVIVVVGPEFYDAVRAGVAHMGWSGRVSTW